MLNNLLKIEIPKNVKKKIENSHSVVVVPPKQIVQIIKFDTTRNESHDSELNAKIDQYMGFAVEIQISFP